MTVVASASAYLGDLNSPGANASLSFDAGGGDFLVVCVTSTYADAQAPAMPTVTYGSATLTHMTALGISDAANFGRLEIYTLSRPAAGSNQLTVTVPWFFGAAAVAVVSLSGINGQLGAHNAAIEAGESGPELVVSVSDTLPNSEMVGFVAEFFANMTTPTANGWTEETTAAGANSRITAFSATSSGGQVTLAAQSSTFEFFAAVALELLPGNIATKPINVTAAQIFCTGGVDTTGESETGNIVFNFMTGSLPQATAFSRASTAPYINANGHLAVAGVNQPRFTWSEQGHLRGLLVEGPKYNTCWPSAGIDSNVGTWGGAGGVTITPNVPEVLAPDGSATATLLQETATNSGHSIGISGETLAPNRLNTVSIYARLGSGGVNRFLVLLFNPAHTASGVREAVNFDLSNGAAAGTTTLAPAAYGIEPAGGGWWRCWATSLIGPDPAAGGVSVALDNNSSPNSTVYMGNTNASVLIWGAQVERRAGPPGPYTPTTTEPAIVQAEEVLELTSLLPIEYNVTIERESGTTYLPNVILTDWQWRVPVDESPIQRIVMAGISGLPDGVGVGGSVEARLNWDAGGADLAIFVLGFTHELPPPELSFGGRPVAFVAELGNSVPTVGHLYLCALADPPTGEQEIRIWAQDRYIGQVVVQAVGLTGASGVLGFRLADGGDFLATHTVTFENTRLDSLLLLADTSFWARPESLAAAGWAELAYGESDYTKAWLFQRPGGGYVQAVLERTAHFGWQQIIGLEILPALDQAPDVTAAGTWQPSPLWHDAILARAFYPDPTGQIFTSYYESWMDRPARPNPQPADYALTRIPPYLKRIILHTTVPMNTYQNLDSDVRATTGLKFPGTGRELRAVLDLLRARRPDIEILVSIMQLANLPGDGYGSLREPYHPQGFGGMTQDHWGSLRRFVDDMGLNGLDLDYECGSSVNDLAYQCRTDENGQRVCYTDAEQVALVKQARQTFPREQGYLLTAAFVHVGCYGEDEFRKAQPGGWFAGYNLCIARDPETADALDAIHLMSYDAGTVYKPWEGLASVQRYFPNTPAFIGLRLGTLEWGPTPSERPRRNLYELTDYANRSILMNAGGAFLYAMLWDFFDPSATLYSPTGQYGPEYPDANMTAGMIARVYDTGYGDVPLIGRRPPQLLGTLAFITPHGVIQPPPVQQVPWRVTEEGDRRLTEEGDRRRTEA